MTPPHLKDIVYDRPKTLDSTFDAGGDTSSTLIAVSNMCEFVNIQTILGQSRIYVLVYQHPNHPRWAPDQNKTHKNANISQGARLWCCNTGSLEVFGTRYFQISIQVWNILKLNIFRYIVGGGIHLIGFAILSVCFKSRAPGAKTITTFIRARCLEFAIIIQTLIKEFEKGIWHVWPPSCIWKNNWVMCLVVRYSKEAHYVFLAYCFFTNFVIFAGLLVDATGAINILVD